jgi:hypothetical protein
VIKEAMATKWYTALTKARTYMLIGELSRKGVFGLVLLDKRWIAAWRR